MVFRQHVAFRHQPPSAEPGHSATIRVRVASRLAERTFTHQIVCAGQRGLTFHGKGFVVALHLQVFDSFANVGPYRERWDRLADGVVFRSFDWQRLWWEHYGQLDPRRELHLVVVRDDSHGDQACIAIAPLMVERTVTRGTVVRWLGAGEVCSDHLSLLVSPGHEPEVAGALADHLLGDLTWDLLQLEAVDEGDPAVAALATALAQRECLARETNTGNCWSIELPADWEAFLALQSKSHRKQLRQAHDRVVATSRAEWHLAATPEEFQKAWSVFVDLHQRRRQSLGEPGCFASVQFGQFHRELAQVLLPQSKLRLSWLDLDGAPAAAEYHFADERTTFAYQGGVDPSRLGEEPGRLSNIATIRHAIAEGHHRFDLLRGDEPYKAHWRATPRATYRLEAVAPHTLSRWRARSYDWATSMAGKLRAGLKGMSAGATPTNGKGGSR